MGSSKTSTPEPPSASETSAEAIQAQINALPQILQAQKEYGPQFEQLSIDQAIQFAPQLNKLVKSQMAELNPEQVAGQQVLTKYLQQEDLLSPEELRQAREDARSAYGVRGMGMSGMAAQQEYIDLTKLRQSLKAQQLNTALSVMGLTPTTTNAATTGMSSNTGQLVSNVSPSDIFGLTSNVYSNLTSQYSAKQNALTTQRGQNFDLYKTIWNSPIPGMSSMSGGSGGGKS